MAIFRCHSIMFVILGSLLLTLKNCEGAEDYCSFSPQHLLCNYQNRASPSCGSDVKRIFNSQEKDQLLRHHNEARSKVAQGLETKGSPGPQPQASNMLQMFWDDELQKIAQAHADNCVFKHSCSSCRRTSKSLSGENLYMSQITGGQPVMITEIEQAVKSFFDEVKALDSSKVVNFGKSVHGTIGHYTQLVWANSYKVGCGYTSANSHGVYNTQISCEYAPVGNVISLPIYKQGPPCSECPKGSHCSSQYPGLCTVENESDFKLEDAPQMFMNDDLSKGIPKDFFRGMPNGFFQNMPQGQSPGLSGEQPHGSSGGNSPPQQLSMMQRNTLVRNHFKLLKNQTRLDYKLRLLKQEMDSSPVELKRKLLKKQARLEYKLQLLKQDVDSSAAELKKSGMTITPA